MTDYIAIGISFLSLMISVLSFIYAWRAFRRDRSDLRVTLEYCPETGRGTAFRVILVNRGRRPVTVEKVQLRLKSGKEWSYVELSNKNANLPVMLPAVLGETESRDFLFPLYDGKGVIGNPLEIERVEAYDTVGKRYTFPTGKIKSRIDFFRLKRQIAKHWTVTENES